MRRQEIQEDNKALASRIRSMKPVFQFEAPVERLPQRPRTSELGKEEKDRIERINNTRATLSAADQVRDTIKARAKLRPRKLGKRAPPTLKLPGDARRPSSVHPLVAMIIRERG